MCVCLCVHTFKHEYLPKQWADHDQILTEASFGWGKDALGFWRGQIGTLATNSSHRVIMGKNLVKTLALSFLIGSFSFLQVTRTSITS